MALGPIVEKADYRTKAPIPPHGNFKQSYRLSDSDGEAMTHRN